MRYLKRTALAIGAAAMLLAPAAAREDGSERLVSTDIRLGGQIVMRLREGAGGYSPERRADLVRERLVPILSLADLRPDDVRVHRAGGGVYASIYVRNRLLVTVARPLAEANRTTPFALAQIWADRLRDVLPEVAVKGIAQTDACQAHAARDGRRMLRREA